MGVTGIAADRNKLRRALYKRGWTRGPLTGSMRHRLHDIVGNRHPWYDWGHLLMTLIGQYRSGSWDAPRVRDMWFRQGPTRGSFITTRSYEDVRNTPNNEWRIFDSQDDGHTILIGWYPRPDDPRGNIHLSGLDGKPEQRLFLRWFLWDGLIKAEWFGLRTWIYYKALHRAVQIRRPFTCQQQPSRNSGGYDHWYCELPKRHKGPHQVRMYAWDESGRCEYLGDDQHA